MKRQISYLEEIYVDEYTPFWQVCLIRYRELNEDLPIALKYLIKLERK